MRVEVSGVSGLGVLGSAEEEVSWFVGFLGNRES